MIPFSPPRIHPEVIKEIEDTLKSGWITTGPKTKLFEKMLTDYTGCQVTNAVNSATAGMEMVLRWFGVGPGDEVIVPAYTYCATANVVINLGATPIMVDINADNFNINVPEIHKAISDKTKVIVPVDIGGFPCDYEEIYKLVFDPANKAKFNPGNDIQKQLGRILIMSDAAHAFGGTYQGKRCGSLSDVSVFSFHAVKNLTTAEGGAICWNLPDSFSHDTIYQHINTRVLHGQSKDALAKTKVGGWRYDVEEPGFKCNMTDIQASIGLISLKYYHEELERRRSIVQTYNNRLGQYDWAIVPPMKNDGTETSYHLYLFRVKGISADQRDSIIERIANAGVGVNVHFIPLTELTAYKKRGYRSEDYPNTIEAFSNEISLPVYYNLTDGQLETVIKTVSDCINEEING